MARREIVLIASDLSGEEGASTVRFTFDGIDYEIDLTDSEVKDFGEAVAPYTDNARRVAGVVRNRRRRVSNDASEIRDWANANGFTVPSRGRISGEIRAAYESAHRG